MVGTEGGPSLDDEQREVRTLHENPVGDQAVGEPAANKDKLGRHEAPSASSGSPQTSNRTGRREGSNARRVDTQAGGSALTISIISTGRAPSPFHSGFRSKVNVSTLKSDRKDRVSRPAARASIERRRISLKLITVTRERVDNIGLLVAGPYSSDWHT